MDEATRKAGVLIEALAWIRQFRDRYIIIKLGGSALENPEAVKSFLTDVIFLETVGMRPVVIHGGGKEISQAMEEAGIEPRWVQGRRYTDQKTLEIAANVLARDICTRLIDEVASQGATAVGLSFATGKNVLIAEQLSLTSDSGEEIDLGLVGHVTDINREFLDAITPSFHASPSIETGNCSTSTATPPPRQSLDCSRPKSSSLSATCPDCSATKTIPIR